MKRTLHRALSMLLTAAMVLNMGLPTVFAEGENPPCISGVCTHHTHTKDCGYQAGTPCNHEHTEECYTKELTCGLVEGEAPEIATDSDAPAGEAHSHGEDCYAQTKKCQHEHNDACGYSADSTCKFDPASCDQCNPGDKPQEKVCTCPPVDSSELVHGKDCPLYTAPEQSEAVQALIAMVDTLPNAADITEENKEDTIPAFEAVAAAYETLSDEDKAIFDTTEQYKKLMTLRDALYGIALMKNEQTWNIGTDGTLVLDNGCGDSCKGHTVTGTSSGVSYIDVKGGKHDVTLDGVRIEIASELIKSAFSISGGSTVRLTLKNLNILKSGGKEGQGHAGLEVIGGSNLIITRSSTGTLHTTGGLGGAGIGGGTAGGTGLVEIVGGKVEAYGGLSSAGIGGGGIKGWDGVVEIADGTIIAVGGDGPIRTNGNGGWKDEVGYGGAGIGGGVGGNIRTIKIGGGTVTATGGGEAAGIGGGCQAGGGETIINGGTVTAKGRGRSAGIGGGGCDPQYWHNAGGGGNITIRGGTVNAEGHDYAAGIGGGTNAYSGKIVISGEPVIHVKKGDLAVNYIGSAPMPGYRIESDVRKEGGLIFEGNNGKVYGFYELPGNLVVDTNQTLEVVAKAKLIMPRRSSLAVKGKMIVNGELNNSSTLELVGSGKVEGSGRYTGEGWVTLGGSMIKPPTNLIHNGQPKQISVQLLDKQYEEAYDYTVVYDPTDLVAQAGTVVTPTVTTVENSKLVGGSVKGYPYTIAKTGSDMTITTSKSEYTYDDEITFDVMAQVVAPKTRAAVRNYVDIYCGTTKLASGKLDVSDGIGRASLTYHTENKGIPIGKQTIRAEYGGSDVLSGQKRTMELTLNPKELRIDVRYEHNKVYDGTPYFTDRPLVVLDEAVIDNKSDDVTCVGSGYVTNKDASVGNKKFITFTGTTLGGSCAGWYKPTTEKVIGYNPSINITPRDVTGTLDDTRTILRGATSFQKPVILGVIGEEMEGTFTYSYNGETNYNKIGLELAKLPNGTSAEIAYTFVARGNYSGTITGKRTVNVVDLQFAGENAALIVNPKPTYGNRWGDILKYDGSKLSAKLDNVPIAGKFTLTVDGKPFDGTKPATKGTVPYTLTFTATGNRSYQDVAVISGKVKVEGRAAALSWGNTAFTYSGKPQIPTATVANAASGDTLTVTVTGAQTNAGDSYTATATAVTGTNAANYTLPPNSTTTFHISPATAVGNVVLATSDVNSNNKLDSGDTISADISGITPVGGTPSYQWQKTVNDTTSNIDGATASVYTIVANDTDCKISCVVTFSGNVTGTLDSDRLGINKTLLNGTATLRGNTSVNSTLTATFSGMNPRLTYTDCTIAWYRDGELIPGAEELGYTITKYDLGRTITVRITARRESAEFTGSITSAGRSIPATKPEKPVITAVSGNNSVTISWAKPVDNGSAITGCSMTMKQGETPVAGSPFAIGADATSYTVKNLTNGTEYSFMLTATNSEGSTDSDVIKGTPTDPSSGGGGNGNSGGNSNDSDNSSQTKPPTTESKPENGNVNLKPSVDKDGNATVTVSDKNVDDAIKKAQDEAKKNGTEKNGIAVTITLDTNQTINSFTANLPKSTQEKLINAGVTTLTINGGATITFDLEAIKQLSATANADVVVTATKTANSTLSKEAQAATGGRPVYDFKVTGGGKNIAGFGNGKLELSIPYELQKVDGNGKPSATGSFENPGNLVGVYINANGELAYLPGSSYNAASKTMLIRTTHLSVYGVAYKTNAPTFTDIAGHWAKDDIEFVAARGVLTGTTATTFSPNTSMTRGMFVTALGRLAGVDPNSYKTGSFTDVKTDAYYAPYVNWAVKNNIVTGTSTTTFAPDSAITRQEMAVMTANYAKAIGCKLPSVHKEIVFTDNASIGTWAKSAVKEMQMAGILMGKDGGKFDPTGTATRAEVSAMLRRFIELVENSETAEGWVTNGKNIFSTIHPGDELKIPQK